MKYPSLTEIPSYPSSVEAFLGYDHNLRIGEGEFYTMHNMSSDRYPVLAPRRKRGTYASLTAPGGLIAKDNICYVDGSKFYMDGYGVDLGLTAGQKQLVSMGAYVVIFPDKKYINTADLSDYGSMEAKYQSGERRVSFTLCKLDGEDYKDTVTSETPPDMPTPGQMWVDISVTPARLMQWNESGEEWVQVATTYIRIHATDIGKQFKEFDGVTISGLTGSDNPDIAAIDGSFSIWATGDDYIVIVGMLAQAEVGTYNMTIERWVPEMDFVVESNNRLWGCRYGLNRKGDVVNEIYASKLGDFRNWNIFLGTATDSYIASVGTDGQFTGAVSHLGYPLFFKENCVHKVYGNYPANYQIQTTALRGVQKGSAASIATCNEVLYYKSRTGVCAYDGSLPTDISESFGGIDYTEAVGGAHGSKYYISMKAPGNVWHLFVYDTLKRMWHREDNTRAMCFESARNELYYIDADDRKIHTVMGSGEPESDFQWMAETGNIGVEAGSNQYINSMTAGAKYIQSLQIRLSMDPGSWVRIYAQYDDSGIWEQLATMEATTLRSYTVPLRPRRCDHMRLKIMGWGDVRIYSITKVIAGGSGTFSQSGQVLDF